MKIIIGIISIYIICVLFLASLISNIDGVKPFTKSVGMAAISIGIAFSVAGIISAILFWSLT